jgi:hypothetical protein
MFAYDNLTMQGCAEGSLTVCDFMSKGLWMHPGQVVEVLAKVAKQVQNAEAEAEKRRGILKAIEELQEMCMECSWLAQYDQDDGRYRVGTRMPAWPVACRPTLTFVPDASH